MAAPAVDEEDYQPLVRSNNKKDDTLAKAQSLFHRHWKWTGVLFALSLITIAIFNKKESAYNGTEVKNKWSFGGKCSKKCQEHQELHESKWGGSLLDTATMIRRAQEEKEKLVARLKVDYGEQYYRLLFLNDKDESIGKWAFHGANATLDVSRRRFIRKLKMKILSVQVAVQDEAKNVNGCNCGVGKNRNLQNDSNEEDENDPTASLPNHYARMVFANGGHSSAAGHGNYFNQTYTAVMERSAKDVFAAVGIELEGRNHAMGGMSSAPEIALCNEAIFGLDADLITWNFGMTDGNAFWKHSLYSSRRGMHRNRPLMLELDAGTGNDWAFKQRAKTLQQLEEAGLAAMFMSVSYMYDNQGKDWFPDVTNMSQAEIDAVPEYLRYYKCGESIEKGDLCANDEIKYTHLCTPHKAPWHPGWKAHALNGNILAMFMIELLLDALTDIQEDEPLNPELEPPRPKDMLAQLQLQEDEDYDSFFNSDVPDYEYVSNNKGLWNESIHQDHALLFRHPAFCHTAILPSETRYKGYLTEMVNSSFSNFDIGIQKNKADRRGATITSQMQLVYDEKYKNCPTPSDQVAIDYKDYFYVTAKGGASSLTIPNQAEKQAYVAEGHEFHGLIAVCLVQCPWGNCPDGYMGRDEINSGKARIFVNGKEVQELFPLDKCSLLRGEDGYVWKPNRRDQYELTAMVYDTDGFMQITSFILI